MTEVNRGKPEGSGVELACNGKDVPLNPFVQRFIEETVRGMVKALDGVPDSLKTIEIAIRKE